MSTKTRLRLKYYEGIVWALSLIVQSGIILAGIDLPKDNGIVLAISAICMIIVLASMAFMVPAILSARKRYKEHDFHELAKKVGVTGGYSERY